MMAMGVPLHLIYALWKGDERGNFHPEGVNCLPPAIPVGSQLLHAIGTRYGLLSGRIEMKLPLVSGDGSSSQGDFHEALNFASVFGARTLFLYRTINMLFRFLFQNRQRLGQLLRSRLHTR